MYRQADACRSPLRKSDSRTEPGGIGRAPHGREFWLCLCVLILLNPAVSAQLQEWPDIRSVPADLEVPAITVDAPAAGLRVRRSLEDWDPDRIYHALYLPREWKPETQLPVIVEYAGNGGYRDPLGDECTGRPEGCSLGFGMSSGEGFIWICLPYLNNSGTDLALTWWGDPPTFDPQPTLAYCRAAVDDTCRNFGGDSSRVILCGFSRGAIACNYLGLYDDETAKLWRAFVPCSHYDGVRKWPFPGSDSNSATQRLTRLGDRPQFICGERDQTDQSRAYLLPLAPNANLTFASTGFRNHSDKWILRPGPAREQLREWLRTVSRSSTPGSG